MTKRQDYWANRLKSEMEHRIELDAEMGKEYKRIYDLHQNNIEKEINNFIQKYGSGEGLTQAQVKKRVSEMDVQAFADKATQYVKEKNFSTKANEELKLYNLKMKISRLELLQYHIDLEMVALADGEYKLTGKYLDEAYIEELRLQAGIMGEIVPDPATIRQSGQAIINTPYKGAVWSDSLWDRQDILRSIVADTAMDAVLEGKSALKVVPALRKEFGVGEYQARRLAITETARIQTAVQKASYEANGFDMFDLIEKPTACDDCKRIAREGPYYVKDMEPGKNAAPIHPFVIARLDHHLVARS